MRQIKYTLLLCLLISNMSFIEKKEAMAWTYIDEFKELAIAEMHRTGIPASITLAQGLHESNYGQSDLAIKANNHFGIKCKSYWAGMTYYHKDDDYQGGRLIESCFRAYPSSLESYVDHSNFLTRHKHYRHLFDYGRTDYTSWAHGLKQSGYATDPTYAGKLISKIEKYYLDQYDHWDNPFVKK